jgi:hypothetical protein
MYATTPKLKKSVEGSAKVQLRTSGAMKPMVPTKPVLTTVYRDGGHEQLISKGGM